MGNYHNVSNLLPDFDLIGGFSGRSDLSGLQYPRGGFVDTALNKSTCTLGLGVNTAAVLTKMVESTFGNGFMQSRSQQTRHTFSNVLFGHQTANTARTYHYNIVERMISGVAIDGSNFPYRFADGLAPQPVRLLPGWRGGQRAVQRPLNAV